MPSKKWVMRKEDKLFVKNIDDAELLWNKLRDIGSMIQELKEYCTGEGMWEVLARETGKWFENVSSAINRLIKLDKKCLRITERDITYDTYAKIYEEKYIKGLSPKLREDWFSKFEQLIKEDKQLNESLRKEELSMLVVLKRCRSLLKRQDTVEKGKQILGATLEYLDSIQELEAKFAHRKYKDLMYGRSSLKGT